MWSLVGVVVLVNGSRHRYLGRVYGDGGSGMLSPHHGVFFLSLGLFNSLY